MDKINYFKNPKFGLIRVADHEGEPMLCLKDVCEVLEIKNHRDLNKRLGSKGVVLIYTPTKGGVQKMIYVNEPNFYKCVFQSRKPEAEAFQDWVCEEVLPAIRKDGGYMAVQASDTERDILIKAHAIMERGMAELQNRVALQRETIKKQAPKVEYYDNVMQSEETYTTTQVAKEIGFTSGKALYKVLNECRIMYKQSNTWLLYSQYCGKGYTKTRTATFSIGDGKTSTNTTTVWTEKGRAWLHSLNLLESERVKAIDYDEAGELAFY